MEKEVKEIKVVLGVYKQITIGEQICLQSVDSPDHRYDAESFMAALSKVDSSNQSFYVEYGDSRHSSKQMLGQDYLRLHPASIDAVKLCGYVKGPFKVDVSNLEGDLEITATFVAAGALAKLALEHLEANPPTVRFALLSLVDAHMNEGLVIRNVVNIISWNLMLISDPIDYLNPVWPTTDINAIYGKVDWKHLVSADTRFYWSGFTEPQRKLLSLNFKEIASKCVSS